MLRRDKFFYNNQDDFNPDETNCFSTIIENDGTIVWARDMGTAGRDFKINYNGYLTYFNYTSNHWMVMDSNYTIIDSVQCGNGFENSTNAHDFSMYPDGHSLLIGEDKQTMDMTQYGGKPDAKVTTAILQELDANKDVIWEWRGWDHFQITDADSHINLTGFTVDYVHANAVSRDDDGNILLSCRSMSELTKINRETGSIIWRMGGENNQFTFVNDNIPEHFSFQHDLRRLPNGNITIFNNGNYLPVQRSSAKEYQLDEQNKVATLVWYYEHPDVNGFPVYGPATGSAQRLPNGNAIISWGTNTIHEDRPSITEVDINKNITWEMKFDVYGQKSYRVHKYVWNPCEMPKPGQIKVKKITGTSAKIDWKPVNYASSYDVHYRKLGNINWKFKSTDNTSKNLKNLMLDKSYEFQVRTNCLNGYTSDWTPLDTFTTAPAKFLTPENYAEMPLQLYPNPGHEIVMLILGSEHGQQATISIYSITGKLMLTYLQSLSTRKQEVSVNISAMPPGYYFLEVITDEAKQTIRFVKE